MSSVRETEKLSEGRPRPTTETRKAAQMMNRMYSPDPKKNKLVIPMNAAHVALFRNTALGTSAGRRRKTRKVKRKTHRRRR